MPQPLFQRVHQGFDLNTPSSPTFPPHLLQSLEDVASGTPLETARRTLTALGFVEMAPFAGEVGRHTPVHLTVHTWVHPKGVVVAGQHGGGPLERLQSVRLSAVVNFGWQAVSQASAFGRGATWMTLDGQVCSQANPTCEDARTSLLTCLGQLEQEGQLEPFERWAAEADHNNIHNWLFAIGNDALQLMELEVGVDRWLDRATPALKTFMAKRLEDIAASNATVLVANPYKWAEKPLLHVRKLAQEQGISKPTDAEKEQVQRWVEAGYKNPVAHYDFARLRTGLTQAAIMAHQLKELTAQRRLLGWIEKAPVEVLERAVLVPDATGHTLVSLLLKELVNLSSPSNDRTARREKERARPIGQVVVDALKSMTQRLGPETMGRALERDGNLVGMVAGFVRADYSSSTVVNRTQDRLVGDMVELMRVLEALGVVTGPTAVLASFQRTPEEREHQGNLGSPQHLRAFLEPLSPQTDWGPLIAPLVQRQLEASLGDAPKTARPRF